MAENLKGWVMPIPGVGGGLVQSAEDRALPGVRTPDGGRPDTLLAMLAFVAVRSMPADIGIVNGCESPACSRAVKDRLTMLREAFLLRDGRVTLRPAGRVGCVGSGIVLTSTGSSDAVACSMTARLSGVSGTVAAGVSGSVSGMSSAREDTSTVGPKFRLASGGASSSETLRPEISSCVGVVPSPTTFVEASTVNEVCVGGGTVESK